MKVNEILTEGPIWQGVKQVGGGLKQIAGGVGQGIVRTAAALGHQPSQQARSFLNRTDARTQSLQQQTQPAPAQPAPAQPAPAAPQSQPTSSTIIVPQKVGNGPRQATAPQLHPSVQVVQQEPIVLRYKKADYALNDQGQWAPLLNPAKKISQAAQAFFDKQHDISLGAVE